MVNQRIKFQFGIITVIMHLLLAEGTYRQQRVDQKEFRKH